MNTKLSIMQGTFQVIQSVWSAQSSLPSNPTAGTAWNSAQKQPATARRSRTGPCPFQWPLSSRRLLPWSVRSAEMSVRTLDAACLVAVVRTVVHLVTLLCSMDTGPIATLEFIWPAGYQSFKTTHSNVSHKGPESSVQSFLATYHWHCWSFAPSVSKWHRALAASTKATVAAAASATVFLCPVASQITLYVFGKSTSKLIWAELFKTELVQAVKLLGWDTRKQAGSKTISSGAPLGSSVYVGGQAAFQLGMQSGTG